MVAPIMVLRLVAPLPALTNEPSNEAPRHSLVAPRGSAPNAYPFADVCLVVAFAAADDLSRFGVGSRIPLAAMPDISGDDAYLVLPLGAREGIVTAFARGQTGRLAHWFDQALVVRAELDGGRAPRLWVGASWAVRELFDSLEGPRVTAGEVGETARVVNALDGLRSVAPGGLFDTRGVQAAMDRATYVGAGRVGVEGLGLGGDAVEPTWVWCAHDGDLVRVRVALCESEDDTLTAMVMPVTLSR